MAHHRRSVRQRGIRVVIGGIPHFWRREIFEEGARPHYSLTGRITFRLVESGASDLTRFVGNLPRWQEPKPAQRGYRTAPQGRRRAFFSPLHPGRPRAVPARIPRGTGSPSRAQRRRDMNHRRWRFAHAMEADQ